MAAGQVTASNVRGSGRDAPLRFGWRMPMWNPAGAPATSWLPAVRGNLAALRSKCDSDWLSDHFVPGTRWMPSEPDTLECWTATVHFSACPGSPPSVPSFVARMSRWWNPDRSSIAS